MLGARRHVAALMDPAHRDRECRDHRHRDAPVRPWRRGLALGGHHDQAEEADLPDELDALRQPREEATLMDRRDVGEKSRVWIDRRVEEDREQEDRHREWHQRLSRGRRDQEEHRGEWDTNSDEWTSTAEARPDAVR